MSDEYEPTFLRMNANAEFIGQTLADIVRRIMRASISNDGTQKNQAADAVELFLGFFAASNDVRLSEVLDAAVSDLTVERDWDSHEADNLRIAHDATRYLLELSCSDNAARGRASKRWQNVESAIRMREEMRDYRRKKLLAEQMPQAKPPKPWPKK